MARSKWGKRTLKLRPDHTWRTKPGYTIFVADRGAVRFDFPKDWIVIPDEKGTIKFHDKQPPDDDCTLHLTVMYLREDVDWSGLPLDRMLADVTSKDREGVVERGEVVREQRPYLELVWRETRFTDKTQDHREAFSRTALAKLGTIMPILTFDFWASDAPRLLPVWDEVLRTLRLGAYVEDPTRGYLPRG